MSGQRLTEQLQLVFGPAEEAATSTAGYQGAEPVVAKCEPERPAVTNSLMEAVCEQENLKKALRRPRWTPQNRPLIDTSKPAIN